MALKKKSSIKRKKPAKGNGDDAKYAKVFDLKKGLSDAQITTLLRASPKIRTFDRQKGKSLTKAQLKALLAEDCGENCPIVTINAPFKLREAEIVS
jgi:hypothetical protein